MADNDPVGVGDVFSENGHPAPRFLRTFPCDKQELWDALTATERTGAWAFPANFEGGSGGTARFTFVEDAFTEGSIVAWEPPVLLEYRYGDPGQEWHLRMRIKAVNGARKLTFDHLAPAPTVPDFAAGWHWHLDRLAQHVVGETSAQKPSDVAFEALVAYYASR